MKWAIPYLTMRLIHANSNVGIPIAAPVPLQHSINHGLASHRVIMIIVIVVNLYNVNIIMRAAMLDKTLRPPQELKFHSRDSPCSSTGIITTNL